MEIQTILQSVSKAYRAFRDAYAPGKTTDWLLAVFRKSLEQDLGTYEIAYDYIWGKDSVNIDGVSADHIPQPGDTLVMDISVGKDGVWCDVCRTFFVGEPTEEQKAAFALIKESLRAGHKALKSGVPASQIYGAANSVYVPQGKSLVHHAGHRIGEKPLLQPQFLQDNDTPLQADAYYTVETGLYERFGIRLENDFLVNENGAEDLFEHLLPLEMEEYILL